MINLDFSGKNVLITGAGGGIGTGIARSYCKAGAKLHLADMNLDLVKKSAQEFIDAGAEVVFHEMDVTNEPQVIAVADAIAKMDGKIDILVNCAGILKQHLYMDGTSEDFEKILAVNLVGMHKVTQAVLKHMLNTGTGKIVNIASASTRKGTAMMPFYSASKFGVQSLTQSVALSVADKNINVNAICPGILLTNMTMSNSDTGFGGMTQDEYLQFFLNKIPQKRFQTPDDIGNTAVFLSSYMADHITGQALNVDGGMLMN